MKKKINILAITSTRADFGILSNLLKKINNDKFINFNLIVTGSHTSKKFGNSYSEIPKNLKLIKVNFNFLKYDQQNIADNSAIIIKKTSKIIRNKKPDLFLILGDRYEIFCAAYSALINYLPIAHIHGGELTQNSLDDALRHGISKMSNIHFVSHKKYKNRLIQLGENKKNIFCFGGLGAENIKKLNVVDKKKLEKIYNIKFKRRNILVTYHPETIKHTNNLQKFKILIKACYKLEKINFIFTYPNFDHGSRDIINLLKKQKNKKNITVIKTFGHQNYLSLLKHCDLMIGNSSSGILEAPSLRKFAINIGDRQTGREFSNNVINCKMNMAEIIKKINHAYVIKNNNRIKNIYYKKDCANKILKTLKNINYNKIYPKKFVDLNMKVI